LVNLPFVKDEQHLFKLSLLPCIEQ
jgi:hypothetical protein